MVKHAEKARPPEKPLTAKALNVFFQTVHTELDKAPMQNITKDCILSDTAENFLPITPMEPKDEFIHTVLSARKEDAERDASIVGHKLPETLSELKVLVRFANSHFDEEPPGQEAYDAAKKRFHEIMKKAYRAAEKEMDGVALPPR